jgi:hypothetical protein
MRFLPSCPTQTEILEPLLYMSMFMPMPIRMSIPKPMPFLCSVVCSLPSIQLGPYMILLLGTNLEATSLSHHVFHCYFRHAIFPF